MTIDDITGMLGSARNKALDSDAIEALSIHLAESIFREAKRIETTREKLKNQGLAKLAESPDKKADLVSLTDQVFRSRVTR